MTEFDLLKAVQPAGGWTAIVGIKNGIPFQILSKGAGAKSAIDSMLAAGRDVYFGVAKFRDRHAHKPRGKANVEALRSFWIDLDCGANKPYPDQKSASGALRAFVKALGLPTPIIVSSGFGLHIYWPLNEDITREQWEPVAITLRDTAKAHGVHADPSCFEVARVLRVPGTLNFKGAHPVPVEVLVEGSGPISYMQFATLIGTAPSSSAIIAPSISAQLPPSARAPSALTQALVEAKDASFGKIVMRAGAGCDQLLSCIKERATLSEPRWRAALSIAQECEDRDKAIRFVSMDHPDYDHADADKKASLTAGPQSCKQFELHNPGTCNGCRWAGLITSPIELGRERPEDAPEDAEEDDAELDHRYDQMLVTQLPPGYEWNGPTIVKRSTGKETKDITVCPYPLIVKKRMTDPEGKFVLVLWAFLPKDGYSEFSIPAGVCSSPRELNGALMSSGVIGKDTKQTGLIGAYVQAAGSRLTHVRKAENMRTQFGWADGDSKFIVGDSEIGADGEHHSPPSPATQNFVRHMIPTGTFDKWKEVINLFGQPGMEAQAFAVGTAFGAPLLRFSGQHGGLINMLYHDSGTGKTTILRACNSIWGNPTKLLAVREDTKLAKLHKLGVHNNLPICFDEMTNADPRDVSDLSYSITQGVGKDRMTASANALRVNNTKWQTIALCSSNESFYDKLEILKNSPDGELMRIIEYEIPPSDMFDPTFAKAMFDQQLEANYGHVGRMYARYLIKNEEEVLRFYGVMQRRFDRIAKLTSRERYWSALFTSNLTGIYVAVKEGWVDWDFNAIFYWAAAMVNDLRSTTTAPAEGPKQVLGEFIHAHLNNILVVNGRSDARSWKNGNIPSNALPVREPKGELMIRHEPDTGLLFIKVSSFRDDCARRNVGYRHTVAAMEKTKLCTGTTNKHLAKGMPEGVSKIGTAVRALVFDATHPDCRVLERLPDPVPEETDAD